MTRKRSRRQLTEVYQITRSRSGQMVEGTQSCQQAGGKFPPQGSKILIPLFWSHMYLGECRHWNRQKGISLASQPSTPIKHEL